MSVNRIASRYAKSLIDMAEERGQLDTVLRDVQTVVHALDSRDLFLLLKSPIVNTTKKLQIFDEVFGKKLQLSELTLGFFKIVLKKGREAYLPEIAAHFVQQYKDLKGITTVRLTTATAISDDVLAKIREKLETSQETKQTVELESLVDADIIGGFILEIGDKLYDASVAHKLEKYKQTFLDNKYVRAY